MSKSAVEFLYELDANKSLEVLINCYIQKSYVLFRPDPSHKIIKAVIETITDKKALLRIQAAQIFIPENSETVMKFNVGTEVYFIKTKIKKLRDHYCFDLTATVIELKRRKEPRYSIPKKWLQTACISKYSVENKTILCGIRDISLSGIRLEFLGGKVIFQKDDPVEIRFKIHRRSELVYQTLVRFTLNRPGQLCVLGLAFINLKTVHKEKIASIIDDLIHYNAINKF